MDSERQWPYDATRLEILAFRAGIDPDELRAWLRAQIDDRLRATLVPERVELRCEECGGSYEISERRARDVRKGRVRALCDDCRHPWKFTPTAEELAWAAAQPPEVRVAIEALLAKF